MKLRLYTTEQDDWMKTDIGHFIGYANQSRDFSIEVELLHVPDLELSTIKDHDGDIVPKWEEMDTVLPHGDADAVGLHITSRVRRKMGIRSSKKGYTLNGSYNVKDTVKPQFFLTADEGQKAKDYPYSEFLRLLLHEFAHAVDHHLNNAPNINVHFWDYQLKSIHNIYTIFDFTAYNQLQRKKSLLMQLADALKQLRMIQELLKKRATYPVDRHYFINRVTQGFMVRNPRYTSGVHPGLDIACPAMTPLVAPNDGELYKSGYTRSLGHYAFYRCLIDERLYWFSFLHLYKTPQEGYYKKGQQMGLIGNSGDSDGSHVHMDTLIVPFNTSRERYYLLNTQDKIQRNARNPYSLLRKAVDNVII